MISLALIPWRWLLLAALAAAVLVGVPILWHRHNADQQQIGYERRAAEDKAAAEAQTARMRDLQRQAELRYTVQATARDRFIVETITEVRHAAQSLAACPVPDSARVQLNAAASCARGDPGSPCAAGEPVPDTR